MKKVVFLGTSSFAATILKGLFESSEYEVVAVVTQPDRPVGRKQELHQSEVSQICDDSVTLLKPESLKSEEIQKTLKGLSADVFVVAAYGRIIPKEILQIPAHGCINVHGSILPRYRGASPIQTAILNGETETGVTIMLMDEELDHGAVLATEALNIDGNDTYPTLEQKMAVLGQNLLLKTLSGYLKGDISPVPQDHSQATYTKILTKQDGHVEWQKSAQQIYDQFRAFSQWPGIYTSFEGKSLKLIAIETYHRFLPNDFKPGEVLNIEGDIVIVCGDNKAVKLLQVQPESGRAMDIQSFVAGRKNFVNSILGPVI